MKKSERAFAVSPISRMRVLWCLLRKIYRSLESRIGVQPAQTWTFIFGGAWGLRESRQASVMDRRWNGHQSEAR